MISRLCLNSFEWKIKVFPNPVFFQYHTATILISAFCWRNQPIRLLSLYFLYLYLLYLSLLSLSLLSWYLLSLSVLEESTNTPLVFVVFVFLVFAFLVFAFLVCVFLVFVFVVFVFVVFIFVVIIFICIYLTLCWRNQPIRPSPLLMVALKARRKGYWRSRMRGEHFGCHRKWRSRTIFGWIWSDGHIWPSGYQTTRKKQWPIGVSLKRAKSSRNVAQRRWH